MKSWIRGKIEKIKKSNCQLDGGTNRCRPNTKFPSTKGKMLELKYLKRLSTKNTKFKYLSEAGISIGRCSS